MEEDREAEIVAVGRENGITGDQVIPFKLALDHIRSSALVSESTTTLTKKLP